ncbi:WD40/YVTN/BNR-like repeat-containing protein [Ralstonia wenshanensis]|uniref:WD40/YVTN/BNR-like repeat-containing protein n=1 Tax=Ralstonia wenshanensis TaxID=2842456 RepID=UPI003D9902F5
MLTDSCKPKRSVGVLAIGAMVAFATLTPNPPAWAKLELLTQPARLNQQASHAVLLAVARAGDRLIAVGESGIVLLSDDNGGTWRQASVPVSVTLTSVYFASAKDGWVVGHSGVVLHSGDGGQTWTRQLDGRQAAQLELEAAKADAKQNGGTAQKRLVNAQRLVEDGPDKPLLDVYFADANTGFVVGAYGLALATRDGGKTWQSLMGQIDNPKGKHLYRIRPVGSELYVAGEQGALYRSGDAGKRFDEIKTPYAGTYFDFIATAQGELLVLGLRGNAYWSGNRGADWQKIETGVPVTLTAGTRLVDGALLMVDQAGRVLRSVNGGRDFTPIAVPHSSSFTGLTQAADGALILSGANGITRISVGNFGGVTSK